MIFTLIKTVKFGILLTFFLTVVYIYKSVSSVIQLENIYLLAFAYTLTMIAIFAFNNITDKKEDKKNKRKTKYNIQIFLFSLVLLLSTFLFISQKIILSILIILILGILYSVKIKNFKIKNTFLLKNIYVSIIGSMIILIPIWETLSNFNIAIPFSLALFKIILLLDIIWDFKDIKGDRKNNVKTIPSVFGFKRAKKILLIITTLFFFGSWVILNIINPFYILIGLVLYFVNEKRTYWFYESVYYTVSVLLLVLIALT